MRLACAATKPCNDDKTPLFFLMENNNELNTQLVLVHPGLSDDPAGRQNEIGIIVSTDVPGDDFCIGFQDNTRGRYPSGALFRLKPMDEINQLLVDQGARLSFPELKALTQLDLALRYGPGDRAFNALQVAADNPAIHSLCLDLLRVTIPIHQVQNRGR